MLERRHAGPEHLLVVFPNYARFTRLTNAFSKELENYAAMVALYFTYYNFA